MKKLGKIILPVLVFCLMLAVGALADDFAVTVPFNDTFYGYGELELSIGGTVDEDGAISVSYVYAMGEDVTSYLTQDIYAAIEPDLKAALG